jgi:hypothetical protein
MRPLYLITASVDGEQYLQMASKACDKATMDDMSFDLRACGMGFRRTQEN